MDRLIHCPCNMIWKNKIISNELQLSKSLFTSEFFLSNYILAKHLQNVNNAAAEKGETKLQYELEQQKCIFIAILSV